MVERILQEHKHHSKTSNKEMQHHRPEILQAFEYLETKKLIKELNTNPGPGLTYTKGRPKTYFIITEEGLKTLLDANYVPAVKFWEIITGYCMKNEPITQNKIEEYYQIVMRRYFKYPNRGFSFQLENFYDICNKWFQIITKSKSITGDQKLIEVLAINPKIKKKNLDCSINKEYLDFVSKRSFEPYGYLKIDFDDNGDETCELTLLGIMLCLLIIYNNHIGALKCGLYNKQFSFEEYYNKIVSNYRTKLPLIFGKWELLTKVLKELAIYNLILILNKDNIYPTNQNLDSVMLGGNKELCDGIRTISLYNRKLMTFFIRVGQIFLAEITPEMSDSDFEKTWPVIHKFSEASAMLFPEHADPYTDYFFRKGDFEKTEESFAEEISILYYMNLNSQNPISALLDYLLSSEYSELLNHSPSEYLSLILQNDKEKPLLNQWFSKWMHDLTGLQEEILQNTKKMTTNNNING